MHGNVAVVADSSALLLKTAREWRRSRRWRPARRQKKETELLMVMAHGWTVSGKEKRNGTNRGTNEEEE